MTTKNHSEHDCGGAKHRLATGGASNCGPVRCALPMSHWSSRKHVPTDSFQLRQSCIKPSQPLLKACRRQSPLSALKDLICFIRTMLHSCTSATRKNSNVRGSLLLATATIPSQFTILLCSCTDLGVLPFACTCRDYVSNFR